MASPPARGSAELARRFGALRAAIARALQHVHGDDDGDEGPPGGHLAPAAAPPYRESVMKCVGVILSVYCRLSWFTRCHMHFGVTVTDAGRLRASDRALASAAARSAIRRARVHHHASFVAQKLHSHLSMADIIAEPGWRYPGADLRSVACSSSREAITKFPLKSYDQE